MQNPELLVSDRAVDVVAPRLSPDAITQVALALHQAERSRVQTRAPSLSHPGITVEDAWFLSGDRRTSAAAANFRAAHAIFLLTR